MIRYLPRRVRELGYRERTLLIYGIIWLALGWGLIAEGDLAWWPLVPKLYALDPTTRAIGWTVSGLAAIAWAWRPERIKADWPAFTLLAIMPAYRGVGALLAWIDAYLPPAAPEGGYDRGWLAGLIYGVMVAAVLNAASVTEAARPVAGREG